MKKTTLDDMQKALDEAYPGQFQIMNSPGPEQVVNDGSWFAENTTKEQRENTVIPTAIAKKYLHCNGCNECQGEEIDVDDEAGDQGVARRR